MIKSELISSVARNDSFRAARVATPISILRPTSVIMPSHQRLHYRFAVVKTKKFSSRISSFSAPVFYFLKGKENFLFCRSVRTSQSWCSRQNEVVLFFNIKYCVIREFSNIPSAFASGITARATRAYILGVCIVCFANCTPQVGGRKESFPQLRAPPRSCIVISSVPF